MNASLLFDAHEAQYTASVLYDTWGHLDAKPNCTYPCSFYAASTGRECLIFNDACSLSGPGYYHDINEFSFTKLVEVGKPEGLYYFEGTYQMYKKRPKEADTIGYFKGKWTRVKLK